MARGKIGVVGSGLIGKQWAMLFAAEGYTVILYDVVFDQVTQALSYIQDEMQNLEEAGFLRGDLSAEEQFKLISGTGNLRQCVENAIHVQECVPDKLELKQAVFAELDQIVGEETVLSSSSSVLPASLYTETLKHRSQCLVSHPVNPPYHMPLVELVSAPWTDPTVLARTKQLMTEIGQTPVILKKEVPGFIQPRIQYAAIQEAIKLVKDGVMTASDVDKILTHGMGLRYSFMGVLETAHLNADGHNSYRARYGEMIHGIQKDLAPAEPLEPDSEAMKKIHQQLCQVTPLDKLEERRAWRDRGIARLAKLKKDMDSQN